MLNLRITNLRSNALSLRTVVVSAGLAIERRVDTGALAEVNLVVGAQTPELPLDKLVVVRVPRCGDERAAPVNARTEALKVRRAKRREVPEGR